MEPGLPSGGERGWGRLWGGLRAASLAAAGMVILALVDHLLAGGLAPGRALGPVAGTAALLGLALVLPLGGVGALLGALVERFLPRPRGAAVLLGMAAGLLFLTAWVAYLLLSDPRLPMRPGRYPWFFYGGAPAALVAALVTWRAWGRARRALWYWAARAWLLLCPLVALWSFSRFNKLYLQEHLSFSLLGGLLLLVWPVRARGRLVVAAVSMLAVLGALGAWQLRAPRARDEAARGGRISRAFLRQLAPLWRAAGHDLAWLGTRAAPATLPATPSPAEELARVQALEATTPKRVILITVDALRADLGGYQSQHGIARLRAEGVSFPQAYSAATNTLESVAGLYFGRYHFQGEAGASLAKRFQEAGWRTITVQPIPHLSTRGHSWITEDFDVYTHDLPYQIQWGPIAKEMTDLFLQKLDEAPQERVFAWLHYYDPHHPYDAEGDTDQARYQAEVARVDVQLGRLIEELEARGFLQDSLLLFTADHGEEFGEHGSETHGLTLYEPLVRVPLIVRAPGGAVRGEVSGVLSALAVPGFLARLAGLAAPNLTARGGLSAWMGRAAVSVRRSGLTTQTWEASIRAGEYKLIYSYDVEAAQLYHLGRDPAEEENLIDAEPAIASALARELAARLSE